MNPFRDRSIEQKAEEILIQLRNGKTEVLVPFFKDLEKDNLNHLLENETKYRIKSWRIGGWSGEGDQFSIKYWVIRNDYESEEEVNFFLVRNADGWKVTEYSAIY